VKQQSGYLTKESGAWLGHFSRWILDHATGQSKRRQIAFKIGPATMTKTEARNKLRERIVQEVGLTADSRTTLSGFIESRWRPLHEGLWREESTKRTNLQLLSIITDRFGNVALEDIDSVQLQGWINSLAKTRSASVVKHVRLFLRNILQEAVEQDFLRKSPARALPNPKKLKLKKVSKPYLSLDQIKALFEAATWYPRERALLRFILTTGLRPSELFALRWRSVDMVKNTLTISETVYRGQLRSYTKTTQEDEGPQVLSIPEKAMPALVQWSAEQLKDGQEKLDPDAFVFPNSEGGLIHLGNYQKRTLNELAKLAGIPKLNFQVLRRSVATHAAEFGTAKTLAAVMRHKDTMTAQSHYVQTIDEAVVKMQDRLAEKFEL